MLTQVLESLLLMWETEMSFLLPALLLDVVAMGSELVVRSSLSLSVLNFKMLAESGMKS